MKGKINSCLAVSLKICQRTKYRVFRRGGACSSRYQNIVFVQNHVDKYINFYELLFLIVMYSREQQAAPLPQNLKFREQTNLQTKR